MTPRSATGHVALLGQDRPSTRSIWHALVRAGFDVNAVIEPPISRVDLTRRRARRLGWSTVVGQVLFTVVAIPLLRRQGRARVEEIQAMYGLDVSPIRGEIVHVPSVNSDAARQALRAIRPDVVVISGTRILGRATLASISVPVLNMHAGITPAYRGVHGGYWALAEARPWLVGTTIHLVDEGIDTGNIIEQQIFEVTTHDSIATYPYLHLAHGIPALVRAVEAALDGGLRPCEPETNGPSVLRYHPTLWGYVYRRIRCGVR